MSLNTESVKNFLLDLQQWIVAMVQSHEPTAHFITDKWTSKLGIGKSCVLAQGEVIEQGGVNFSHVQGEKLPPTASAIRPNIAGKAFEAMGVSVVIHPRNPCAPTSHFNVRLFVADAHSDNPTWWFGGGFDLTPFYGFEEDCVLWHKHARAACDPFGDTLYPRFKQWCDEYFYLKHRNEARGIGGLFFDDFDELGFEQCFAFIQSVGQHYIDAYDAILRRRVASPYGKREQNFQHYRRGRYVEYNLLYDRGTLFGLQSGGRTESILMSLPPVVNWRYNWVPSAGSAEATLYEEFLPARDWLSAEVSATIPNE